MKENDYFRIIYGTIPVLLSAPHAYSHKRPSLGLSYKIGEIYTDSIVEEICANTSAYGIIQTKETPFDANYHKIENNPYKSAVSELIEKEKINRFIDIHGLRDDYEYDLGIYYPSHFIKSIRLATDISNAMNKEKLKGINSCIFRFEEDLQETLGEYIASNLRVPSVQIEIARYIREEDILRNAFVKNLSTFLTV